MKTFANLLLAALCSLVCNVAQGQTSADTVIPEFETIITDAEKAGKDPLEIARYNKEHNIWSMAEYIRFSKYNRGKQAKEAAEREIRITQLNRELTDKGGPANQHLYRFKKRRQIYSERNGYPEQDV